MDTSNDSARTRVDRPLPDLHDEELTDSETDGLRGIDTSNDSTRTRVDRPRLDLHDEELTEDETDDLSGGSAQTRGVPRRTKVDRLHPYLHEEEPTDDEVNGSDAMDASEGSSQAGADRPISELDAG